MRRADIEEQNRPPSPSPPFQVGEGRGEVGRAAKNIASDFVLAPMGGRHLTAELRCELRSQCTKLERRAKSIE